MRAVVIALGLLVGVGGAVIHLLPERATPPKPVAPVSPSILGGLSSAHRSAMLDFFAAMADIVVRDGKSASPEVKTVFDLRNRYKGALALAFANSDMVGKYPDLGDKLDNYLLDAVGRTDVPLTAEVRQAAAKAFAAIR